MDTNGFQKGYFLLNNKKHITRSGVNLIGRNKEATVIIKDTSISQHHALLVILDDGKHYLSDFNSSNGTFLDSTKLQPFRLYEVGQGASVQFAEIKSTYFKADGNAEANTQGSDSSQVADDTLFNVKTQLIVSSIMSPTHPMNKTNGANHVYDHGYSKLLNEDENVLLAASMNDDDANKSVQQQQTPTNSMEDHGYHKKNQVTNIHDLPTQIIGTYDDEVQATNSSIHELPTQLIGVPHEVDIADANSNELSKETVAQKPSSSAVHELPKLNALEVSHLKSVEKKLEETPLTDESVLEAKQNNTGEVVNETLPVVSEQEQNSADKDEDSSDSLNFMEAVTQHFADVTRCLDSRKLRVSQRNVIESDCDSDVDSETEFKLTRMRRTRKKNVLDSSQEAEMDFEPNVAEDRVGKISGPVIQGSDSETDAEDDVAKKGEGKANEMGDQENTSGKIIKSGPVIEDSGSETEAELDVTKEEEDKPKLHSNEMSDQENTSSKIIKSGPVIQDSGSETDVAKKGEDKGKLHSKEMGDQENTGRQIMKSRYIIQDSDSETDAEIDVTKEEKDKPKLHSNEMDDQENTSRKIIESRPVIQDSGSETDAEIDVTKDEPKLHSNEMGDQGNASRKIIQGSDSETDAEIDVTNTKENTPKLHPIQMGDQERVNVEFERQLIADGGTKSVQADSGSETDVDIDTKEEKASDGLDNSPSKETAEIKSDSGNKNEVDRSDSESQLIKTNKAKRYVIESSDETDAEDEITKIKVQTEVVDNKEDSGSETDVENDILSAHGKTKIKSDSNSELISAGKANKTEDVSGANVNQADSEGEMSQADLFATTNIDEEISEDDERGKKNENDDTNSNSRLDDTDVIPPTQNSFIEEVNFDDFNTKDLNYPSGKLEKDRKEKLIENTFNSEESFGDSLRLTLSTSVVEPPEYQKSGSKNPDDLLFQQPTQKSTEDEIGSAFLKPTQKLGAAKNDDGDDNIFSQPTQQLSENHSSSEASEEIFLQPQIIVFEKCSGAKSNDDSVFIKPTQKLGDIEEKTENICRPSQPDDDSIFLEATQKLPEKEKPKEAKFLKPAQVCGEARNSKSQLQAEDNIFMQATQITSEVDKPSASAIKEKDDDIFMQATQIASEVQNSTPIDVFLQPTQVVTDDLKENLQKTPAHSIESQLEVMFASQNVRLMGDEDSRPENPLGNLLSSLRIQPETIEIKDDFPEATTSKEGKKNVDCNKKRPRTKSTDSNDDLQTPRRGSRRKSPQLNNNKSDIEVTKRNTRNTAKKAPAPSDEDKIDLLFKSTKIMENDIFSESVEPVGRRTRRSPQPPEILENNANSRSLRKKVLATVEEQPESSVKFDVISTPSKTEVSAGQRPEEEAHSKKRNVKIKPVDDLGEGTSNDNVEVTVTSVRSRRLKAKSDQEDINANHKTDDISVDETPRRITMRTRNNVEIAHTSDSSNDFDVPIRSESPITTRKTTRETARKTVKLKDSEDETPSTRNKNLKSETKQRTKRTNSVVDDGAEENCVENTKRPKIDSSENESSRNDLRGPLESETPSAGRRTKSRRAQSSVSTVKFEANVPSDDEFAPAVSKKKRKNVADDDAVQNSVKNIPGTPTRRKLLQMQNSTLSTPERLKRKLKPKVVFTMLDSPELESLIRSLGGSVVDTVEACTVLVTGSVKRSLKLLSAVGLRKPICSPKWLQECRKSGSFVDPWDHILVDDEAEKKWHFSLKESLQRSVETKLLEDYTVHIIVNNAQDVLKGAIESCGGKCVTRAPPKNSAPKYMIVSTPENRSKYAKFLKQTPQPTVVAPEAIFDGVLRQELHLEEHRLT